MTQGAAPDPADGAPGTPTPADTTDTTHAESAVPFTFAPTVTLFFSDIRGFTEYTDAHGDAAAFRMLQFHNTMVQEQIALYGGHIVKTLGDSYMVSFNAARNAMACGIGIQKALAHYNEREGGAKIHIGIGINMGEPILDADDFFGGSVNLAARICAVAGAGQILVSEGVRHVVGKMEGTDYLDRGAFELKGFHEPQRLYEVDWSGLGASAATPPARTPSALASQASPAQREASHRTDTQPVPARSAGRNLPLLAGVALVVAAIVGGAVFFMREQGRPSDGGAAGRLLYADAFTDPARGLFAHDLQGIGRITGDGSTPLDFQGNYAYQNGALVARLVGDHPGGDRAVFGRTLLANERLASDFAVEIRARLTGSPNATRFGLQYFPTSAEFFTFTLFPANTGYSVSRTAGQQSQSLATGRAPAMRPPGEDNLLRIQVQGDAARVLVNGREVALARHESLGKRNGQIGIIIAANDVLANRTAEVEFRDFKVFALP